MDPRGRPCSPPPSPLIVAAQVDRGRYDGDRLPHEVDLAAISADVLATVDAAVRPSAAGLWLRERPGGGA